MTVERGTYVGRDDSIVEIIVVIDEVEPRRRRSITVEKKEEVAEPPQRKKKKKKRVVGGFGWKGSRKNPIPSKRIKQEVSTEMLLISILGESDPLMSLGG